MNQRPQATPAPAKAISTPLEARKLAEELMDVMSALLGIIERETELVRAGTDPRGDAARGAEGRTVAAAIWSRSKP